MRLILICAILSFSASKLCTNCKFYTKDFFSSSEFGKCALFFEVKPSSELVNGDTRTYKEYHFCSVSRHFEHLCGNEGKFYEEKPKFLESFFQ